MKAFSAALESLNKPRFAIGQIPPTAGLVDQSFNDSTGDGQDGEIDARGPWNQGAEWQLIEAPAFQDAGVNDGKITAVASVDDRSTSTASEPAMIEELLVEELRDLLSAEGQLVKALPKITKAANAGRLKVAEDHLEETKAQVERLKECFTLLGAQAKAKPCKGMAGLIEECDEVIEEGKEKDGVAADLALSASAQKAEHYEISAYGTARTMAGQIGLPAVAALLSKSLAEEKIADNLLTQVARDLMSESRTGATKESMSDMARTATDKVNEGREIAADQLESAASTVHDRGGPTARWTEGQGIRACRRGSVEHHC